MTQCQYAHLKPGTPCLMQDATIVCTECGRPTYVQKALVTYMGHNETGEAISDFFDFISKVNCEHCNVPMIWVSQFCRGWNFFVESTTQITESLSNVGKNGKR